MENAAPRRMNRGSLAVAETEKDTRRGAGAPGRQCGLYLLMCPGGDARAGNHRQNKGQQHKNGQGHRHEHWILDSVAVAKVFRARVWPGNTFTRGTAGEGSSQHTRYRRPQVRHSYWPCEGHFGSVCINLHHRSESRACVDIMDADSLPGPVIPKVEWRRGFRSRIPAARATIRRPAFQPPPSPLHTAPEFVRPTAPSFQRWFPSRYG